MIVNARAAMENDLRQAIKKISSSCITNLKWSEDA